MRVKSVEDKTQAIVMSSLKTSAIEKFEKLLQETFYTVSKDYLAGKLPSGTKRIASSIVISLYPSLSDYNKAEYLVQVSTKLNTFGKPLRYMKRTGESVTPSFELSELSVIQIELLSRSLYDLYDLHVQESERDSNRLKRFEAYHEQQVNQNMG